jgi:hypothetical protein
MAAGGFGNFNEQVRDLLRRRRQQRFEENLAVTREAMKDAPVSEPPAEMMRELSRLRRSSRRRQ